MIRSGLCVSGAALLVPGTGFAGHVRASGLSHRARGRGGQGRSRGRVEAAGASPGHGQSGLDPAQLALLAVLAGGASGRGQPCSCWRRPEGLDLRQAARGFVPGLVVSG